MVAMFTILLVILDMIYGLSDDMYHGVSSQYVIDDPLCKHRSVDNSKTHSPLKIKSRVVDLMNGEHFDDILRDTPNKMRPPSIVLFYNTTTSACNDEFRLLNFENNVINYLPSRAFLFASQYDVNAAPQRLWYKFTPERDLAKRFGINGEECLSLVWVPRECDGFTDWCINRIENGIEYLGCDEFVEQCKGFETYKGSNAPKIDGDWIDWVNKKIDTQASSIEIGGPNPGKKFSSMHEQEKWISGRDSVTTTTQLRNAYGSPALPAFTKLGYKSVEIPPSVMNEFVIFYNKYKSQKRDENWGSWGQTQVNGHEVSPYLIYMDLDMHFRDAVANQFIKPLLEEWVGFELELSSHYGLREYHSGSWLRNHIDRIDVLVISVTLSLFHLKGNNTDEIDLNTIDQWPQGIEWPLEGVDFEGNNVRYNHKPGTMVFYESAKLIHGRPYPLPTDNNGNDLVHIGSFCHFRPKDGSWAKNGHATNAQRNIARFKQKERATKHPSFRPPKYYKGDL